MRRVVADRFRAQLREGDLIGRFGGEEFAILLPRTAGPEAGRAADRLRGHIADAPIRLPRFTVISNVDARPYTSVEQIKANLIRSVTDEVRWHDAAIAMIAVGIELIVEFGASPVLAPMMKRVEGAPKAMHVGDVAGVEKLRAMLAPARIS